jgi:polysaccharide export outer membrane protein
LSKDIEEGNLGRVVGNYSPGSKSSMETVLFNGDAIFVPKNPNIINVLGQVYNAAAFEYKKGLSVQDVINNAGGYKDYAYKRRVYVIKANGLIETTNRNIFTKNINLEPGDTIVVPRKINFKNSTIEALLPATKILSDLAFSAAAIESLSRN